MVRRLSAGVAVAAIAAGAWGAVGVNKSFSPNSVTAGQVSTLTIVFLNPNATLATGVALTDTLPTNVTVANPLTVGSNTCGFAVGATPGTQPIVLSGGTIPALSGSAPGQCQVTINVVASIPSTYLNTIPAGAVSSSQGTNAQSAQATLVVGAPANITAAKAFVPANLHGNGGTQVSVSRLTITLTNPNTLALTNAAITDSLPAAVTIATPANAATTCGAGLATASPPATNPATLSLTGGTIPASGSCTLAVDVIARNPTAAANGNQTNSVPANALTTAEGATSPAFTATVNVQTGALVTKTFAPNPIAPGGATPSTMTITLTNYNATTLAPVDFSDTWPATMTATGASTTCGGTVNFTATSVTLTGGSLGPAPTGAGGTSCTITVPVTATASTTNAVPAGTLGGVNYAAATGTLTVSSILGSKSFTTPAYQTGSTTMTITLSTITTITDNLTTMGTGFTVPLGAVPGGTCGSSLTSPVPGTLITLTGGTIPANGSCTIILPVAIGPNSATGNRTNTIAVNGVVTSAGNNLATITGVVNVARALTMAKAFSPANVQAGTRSRLTVTLTRTANASALNGIAFTDALTTMGTGFVVASPANTATTCTGATVTATPGATSFSFAGGSLAGGAAATSCTVALDIATPPGAAPATYTNTIAANAVTTTEGVTNAAVTANLVLSPPTSVTVNKSFNPTTVAVGNTSTMAIQIRNNNAPSIALTGVGLTDTLPAGMVVANPPAPTFTGTGCSGATIAAPNGGSTVILSGANVGAGSICTLTVTVRAAASGNLINSIAPGAVTSAQGVANPLQGTATLAATGSINLNVTKTNGVTSLTPGGTTTYTIGVSNAGPHDVAGLAINDTPPAGVTFGAWTCTPSGGATCGSGSGPIADIVTIPVGGAIAYTVPATIAPAAVGSVTNTVVVTVPGSVINTGNTSATDVDPLVPVTSLAVGKDDGSPTYQPGLGATYAIPITNGGPSDATNVVVTDTFPAGVTQAGPIVCTPIGIGASCGTVSNLGTGFTLAGAYVPAASGSGLALTVPVNFSAALTAPSITNAVTVTNLASSGPGSSASASDTNTLLLLAPSLGKGIAPATIAAGGSATLTLTLGNPNAAPLTLSANLIDTMPAGITTTGANTGTCTGITVAPNSVTMLAGSAIPAGGCTVVVAITSNTPGTVTNTTGALTTNGGVAPPASAPLAVTAVAATLGKAIAPATIPAGGSATLTLTLGNPNASPLTLTAPFTDGMPAGVTTTSANSGTCGGVSVTPTLITMASGSAVPPGGCTIVVTLTSGTPGTVTNTTGTLSTNAGSTPPASAPLTVTALAATLAKNIAPPTIVAGGTATLTLSLGNTNATSLTLASVFVDTMPAGVTTTGGNTGTCGGVTVAPTTVTMASGAPIPPGGCTIIVAITSTTPGTVTNTTGTLQTEGGLTPAASAPITVTAALPSLGKAIAPGTIPSGGSATLTLSLGNTNATPLTLASDFTDPMPAGVTTTSANTGTCGGVTVAPGLITKASGSTIPPGGCTIIVTITSTTPGTVTNITGTLQTEAGVTPAASAPLTVTAVSGALTKTILPATIPTGGAATLTLALANANATSLTLASAFTDPMPAGMTTTSANTGTCAGVTVAPALITMAAGGTIPPGGCTIVVTVTSSTPGTVTNTTSALQTEAGITPPASAPLTVTAANPALAKSMIPATISSGATATLTLTLGNPNAAALTLTAPFTDSMPVGITVTGANSGSCPGVTVTPSLITMAAGSSIAPGGCTIVVGVTSITPGTLTNTTGPLSTAAGTTPPASASLTVLAVVPAQEIPANSPAMLALLLLLLGGLGATFARRR
jgi:uncharacterized repeat protein (TIGR01451 family)